MPKEARERAIYAAEVYREACDIHRSAMLLKKAGFITKAAELLAANKRFAAAAELFLEAKKPEEAAKLFDAQGDTRKGSIFRGEAALLSNDHINAAKHFAAAGDFIRSGDLLSDSGNYARAAKLYQRAGDNRLAGEQYAMADDLDNAASAFEKAGENLRAADIFRRLGDVDSEARNLQHINAHFRLGKLLIENGRKAEGLSQLEKIDPINPRYQDAAELHGDILVEMNQDEAAIAKFKSGISSHEVTVDNAELYYKVANCMERIGDDNEAFKIFERILAFDFHFEDVQARMDNIRRQTSGPDGLRYKSGGRSNSRGGSSDSRLERNPLSRSARNNESDDGTLRYEVIDEIARGGMGVVYRAKDTVLNRVVAYKILSDNLKNNATAVKYFLREARAAAALSHHNIVTVYDAGEQKGEYYMAMELVHGETIKSLITRSGPFHEKLLRFVTVHACRGLAYAHSKGVVHRDIKSGNMMLTKDKALKIMDFGLAKFIEEYQSQHTKAIGTPFYMSPEQILGRDLDHRSDLYSLGVTLFECSTGSVPFFKGELSYHHIHTKPPSPRSLNPSLSKYMEAVILKLIEKEPDKRFQSANSILKALKTK